MCDPMPATCIVQCTACGDDRDFAEQLLIPCSSAAASRTAFMLLPDDSNLCMNVQVRKVQIKMRDGIPHFGFVGKDAKLSEKIHGGVHSHQAKWDRCAEHVDLVMRLACAIIKDSTWYVPPEAEPMETDRIKMTWRVFVGRKESVISYIMARPAPTQNGIEHVYAHLLYLELKDKKELRDSVLHNADQVWPDFEAWGEGTCAPLYNNAYYIQYIPFVNILGLSRPDAVMLDALTHCPFQGGMKRSIPTDWGWSASSRRSTQTDAAEKTFDVCFQRVGDADRTDVHTFSDQSGDITLAELLQTFGKVGDVYLHPVVAGSVRDNLLKPSDTLYSLFFRTFKSNPEPMVIHLGKETPGRRDERIQEEKIMTHEEKKRIHEEEAMEIDKKKRIHEEEKRIHDEEVDKKKRIHDEEVDKKKRIHDEEARELDKIIKKSESFPSIYTNEKVQADIARIEQERAKALQNIR